MKRFLTTFKTDESGAVTVDFVVLTATLVLLGFLVLAVIGGAAEDHANWLKGTMTDMTTP